MDDAPQPRRLLGDAGRSLATLGSWPSWLFAAAYTAATVLGHRVVFTGDMAGHLDKNYVAPFSAGDVIAFVLLTPLVALLVNVLYAVVARSSLAERVARAHETSGWREVAWVAGGAGALLLAWSPYLLTYAPGTVVGDSLVSLGVEPGHLSNHHPLLYALMLFPFKAVGRAAGDMTVGVLAYTAVQSFVLAVAISYGVLWLAKRGAPLAWCGVTYLYFALVPVFPIYALNMQKDPLFSAVIAAFTMLLYDVARTRGELLRRPNGIAWLLALGALTMFLRNNGIYVFVGTVAAVALVYRREARKAVLASLALVLVTVVVQGPVYSALHVRKDTVVESFGIPLQQVAYVIASGGRVSGSDRAFLGKVMTYGEWGSTYTPTLVDPLKKHRGFHQGYLSRHAARFLAVWAHLLAENPVAFLKAYLLETFGFWKLGVTNSYGYADTFVHANDFGIRPVDLWARLTGASIKPLLDGLRGPAGNRGFVSTGLLVWLTFLVAALVAMRRRWDLVLVALPCVLLWATVMLATPVAFSLRYVFAMAVCMPGLLLLPFVPGASRAA